MIKPRRKIERHLPPVGTVLEGLFHNQRYRAVIVEHPDFPDGKAVSFDNVLYRSMTAAAQAVTKQSTNGWRFWRLWNGPVSLAMFPVSLMDSPKDIDGYV